ncbi:hypothetical protein IIV31_167R [Armadillidium vulgare iridescent virus]|uniref:Uncharacterized protein n=1 Tax=Armadillidium vulgare iridescent virus TaxID=72201 RepID=A0A068QLR5_9VIRU|nr:hypothetical protein IIV31_167R [Armadillidium vulgare iridescent virus]CCV02539.1 hypothetical protein IIV31_167R [Armadillidium vulgare iridescent virus]
MKFKQIKMQFLLLIIIAIVIIFFLFANGESNPFDVFKHQKSYVLHRINKLLKKDVSAVLNGLFKPFDANCVAIMKSLPRNYNFEEIELLKTQNIPEFQKIHNCGYIHNLFMVVALSLWAESAKAKTEASLTSFIAECLNPIVTSPNFKNGVMIYTVTKAGILNCMTLKNI